MTNDLPKAANRLLSAALDYCAADTDLLLAQKQVQDLRAHHQNGVACCETRAGDDFEDDPKPPLPRSKWCKHCVKYVKTATTDGDWSRWKRRYARQRMKRAYRQIEAQRPALLDLIVGLYHSGHIRKRFRVADVIPFVAGTFSDTDVRDGLMDLSRQKHGRSLKSIAKYTFELSD